MFATVMTQGLFDPSAVGQAATADCLPAAATVARMHLLNQGSMLFVLPATAKHVPRAVVVTSMMLLFACTLLDVKVAQATDEPPVDAADSIAAGPGALAMPLRLLSLNVAHGRRSGINQALESQETIRSNLQEVAAFLERTGPAIVALQEADAPSRWSGSFDHVAFLAATADYPWYALAAHASSWLFAYGTALMSRGPFVEVIDHAFESTPPTATKGFVLGCIAVRASIEAQRTFQIDIVSVHLDFSRRSVRQRQIEEMARVLADRSNPLIVLGDFNSEWTSKDSAVRQFAELRGLRAYRPEVDDLNTYPDRQLRLDWILLSPDLEFTQYEVLPDVLSDHLAVLAEVRLRAVASHDDPESGAR